MRRYHKNPGTSSKDRLSSEEDSTQLVRRGKKRKSDELLAPRANRSVNADITTHPQEHSPFDRYLRNEQKLKEIVKELGDSPNSGTMALLRNAAECIKVMVQMIQRINAPSSNIIQRGE